MAEAAGQIAVEEAARLARRDLEELCDATEAAIEAGGGFGWLKPPPRRVLEAYWRGVLLVPERLLLLGRLDGVIAGSAQLIKPSRNNEAQAHAGTLTTSFVAPWARGHGLARALTVAVEEAARAAGLAILNLDLRASQDAAIALYGRLGYRRWGTHPCYARVDGEWVAGHFYYKELAPDVPPAREASAGRGRHRGKVEA